MTIENIIERLSVYPKDFKVTDEFGERFRFMMNGEDSVLLSTSFPVGYSDTGEYVYRKKAVLHGVYISPIEGGREVLEEELLPLKEKTYD